MRYTNDPTVAVSVLYVGIGDLFAIAGQSNASGQGTNNQSYSHATLKAALFGNDYTWKELVDPTDDPTGQVDAVSLDNGAGSPWPLLATSLMAATGFPVAFVPCPMTTTAVAAWAPGADHSDRATLYGSMNYRITQVGGARCVLWHQGERDVVLGTAEATYNAGLDTIANAIDTDQSIKLVACKLQDLSANPPGYDESTINSAINTAWGDNANVLQGPDFSDITPSVDGLHFKTDAELSTAASRWATAIKAAFGW